MPKCEYCGIRGDAHVEEDFYDALQHPSPDLTVRDARIMCAYLARIGTEEYK